MRPYLDAGPVMLEAALARYESRNGPVARVVLDVPMFAFLVGKTASPRHEVPPALYSRLFLFMQAAVEVREVGDWRVELSRTARRTRVVCERAAFAT